MPSLNVIQTITEIHGNQEALEALALKRDALKTQVRALHESLAEIEEVLRLSTVVSRIHNGTPVVVHDTTAAGGTWISVHTPDYSKCGNRHAQVSENVQTKEWMLSISGSGLRNGGEIIAHDSDRHKLIELACDWVVDGSR
jgi:hypothetical protein